MSGFTLSDPPSYLSAASANALISDIQPTSIHPQTLQHINLFLDEILYSLLAASESLNPTEIRSTGVPAVFSADKSSESTAIRSLGRSAVGEAELELRSWVESNGSLREGFGRDGKGSGMKRGGFALGQAYEVMRGRCEEFSTLAGEDGPRSSVEGQRMAAWVAVGGNGDDAVLSPAALYLTAILEHVCEHVLAALSRVVGRDSDNTTASLEDLFTAVAEDDGIWGFFKRMQVRVSLEEAIKARQKRAHPSRPADRLARSSPGNGSQTSLVQPSTAGGIRDQDSTKKSSNPPSSYDHRPSQDTYRSGIAGGIGSSTMHKSPSLGSTSRFGPGISANRDAHVRSPSVLSASTRNMIGAYNEQDSGSGGRSRRDEEDDFDALVASGETMKVSLTPSRLKNFEGTRSKNTSPNQKSYSRRDRPSGASPPGQDDLPPLLPRGTPQSADDTPPRPPRSSSMRLGGGGDSAPSAPAAATRKLQPRGASILPETDDSEDLADELDSPFKPRTGAGRGGKESLADILASTGPASPPPVDLMNGNGEVKRTVPAVILGTAPPRFDDEPTPDVAREGRGSGSQPGRDLSGDEDAGVKKRTPARDMADFFNDGPPPDRLTPSSTHTPTIGGTGGKPKTPAQEMADFFNNTPAPPSSTAPTTRFGAPVENLAPPPAKKGFKGFISKIGGGSSGSKRKGSADQAMEEIPTAGGPNWAGAKGYQAQVRAASLSQQGQSAQGLDGRRQKSIASMGTAAPPVVYGEGGTRASNIADAYRTQQQSRAGQPITIPSAVDSSPSTPITSTPAAQKRLSSSSITSTKGVGLSRKISTRKPVPYGDAGVSPEIPSSPTAASSPQQYSPDLGMSPSARGQPRKPSTVAEDASSAASASDHAHAVVPDQPVSLDEDAVAVVGPAMRTLKEEKSNDQLSFATARERLSGSPTPPEEAEVQTPRVVGGHIVGDPLGTGGVDSVPEAEGLTAEAEDGGREEMGDAGMDTVPEAAAVREEIKSEPALTPISEEVAKRPSIPLAELAPLRHLLDGATSVKECQMLLSAILSQWGVPLAGGDGVDPESRIAAWLLAGRDGPVGDGAEVKGEVDGHGRKASSEGTAVVQQQQGKEGEVTVAGVVEDIKTLAVEGLAKVF